MNVVKRVPETNKMKVCREHSLRRLHQRIDGHWGKMDLGRMTGIIQQGHSLCAMRRSVNKTIHLVEYKDRKIALVYDRNKHIIVTVLPDDAWERQELLKRSENVLERS